MDLPFEHLRTLAAVIDEGSLDGAARVLHISPSAVSQRIRSMEERVGSVLLQRSRPVAVTASGAAVLRAARQVAQVMDDVAVELDAGTGAGSLVKLVINADSLATWFVTALARAAESTGARFEVLRADETLSTEKLRSGEVMAALTATAEAVPGCVSERIGTDQLSAVADPAFFATHFAHGVTADALATAPMIEFDRHDMHQQRFLQRFSAAPVLPPRHFVPSSAAFLSAIQLGLGWGMLPRLQCDALIASGGLVELTPGRPLALPLFWQRWNLRSPVLDQLTSIVAAEARTALTFA